MSTFAGHLRLHAAVRDHGRTVLATQSFRAPFHISKPYWDATAGVLLTQIVNPTAGILAGDHLESAISVDTAAALLVTTPSASRLFQMRGGAARCRQMFRVAANGWLEVSPEPIVPHRGSNYHQITTLEAASSGCLFFVDQLLPGRVAHGEAWCWERLTLELDVRVDGELVLRERIAPSGAELCAQAEFAGSGPTACFGNAVLLAPAASTDLTWRAALTALHSADLWIGVSALRKGGWTIKLIARDGIRLRQGWRDVRRILQPYFPALGCDPRKL